MGYLEGYLGDASGDLSADTGDPCDPNSLAYNPAECGQPVSVNPSDGSAPYTLPVEVFNSSVRYACVYADNSVQMVADGEYSGVGSCPDQGDNVVVQVWDVVNAKSVWEEPASSLPGPSTKPSLSSVIKGIFGPGGVFQTTGSLPAKGGMVPISQFPKSGVMGALGSGAGLLVAGVIGILAFAGLRKRQ